MKTKYSCGTLCGSALIIWILLQIRGYNDGGWFTLYPNFGETANAGPPFFFKVLSYVSIV